MTRQQLTDQLALKWNAEVHTLGWSADYPPDHLALVKACDCPDLVAVLGLTAAELPHMPGDPAAPCVVLGPCPLTACEGPGGGTVFKACPPGRVWPHDVRRWTGQLRAAQERARRREADDDSRRDVLAQGLELAARGRADREAAGLERSRAMLRAEAERDETERMKDPAYRLRKLEQEYRAKLAALEAR
jgi:hypothetical protein